MIIDRRVVITVVCFALSCGFSSTAYAISSQAVNKSDMTNAVDSTGENKWIQAGDIRIGYRSYGSGDPLLMIMGYGATMNLWETALIERLASRYQVIVFDNRGMGETDAGTVDFSIEQFADDCAGLLDGLGIARAHVLGWSMGAMIAQQLVLQHPAKVESLILYAGECNVTMFPASQAVMQKITDTTGTPEQRGMRFISTLFPPAWISANGNRIKEIFYRPMGNTPSDIIGRQAEAIGRWKGSCSKLAEMNKRTLLLCGDKDVLVPPANSNYLSMKLPDAKLMMIKKGGHGIMFQFPKEFCTEVLTFLE